MTGLGSASPRASRSGSLPGKRRTVSSRILAAFVLVLTLFTTASVWSVSSFRQAVAEASLLRQGYLPLALSLRDLVANQDSYNSQLNHVTAAENPADARAWFEAALSIGRPRKVAEVERALLRAFSAEDSALSRDELSSEFAKVKELLSQDAPLVEQLFLQLSQGHQKRAQVIRDQLVTQGLRAQRSLTRLEKRVESHVDRLLDAAREREKTALLILIFLSGLSVLVGLLTVLYVRRVLRPLSQVTGRATKVAAGDLSSQEPLKTGDEIGELSSTFEEMVQAIFEARERLLASERLAAIGKMAAHVTHEVRNPLSSIALNLELLEDEIDESKAEARNLVRAIGQEVQRLSGLSDQYLSMARRKAPDFEETDVGALIRSAADFMRRDLERHGVQLRFAIDEHLPWVSLDQGQIRQALFNLVRNAREAMVEGGEVKLSAHATSEAVTLSVADTGPGISDAEVTQLFDPFFTTKSHGTGLGLAVTRQIVQAHGAELLYRKNEPTGAVFEIRFRMLGRDAVASSADETDLTPSQRILVAASENT